MIMKKIYSSPEIKERTMSMKYFMSTTSLNPTDDPSKWNQEIDEEAEGTDEPARTSKQSLW
jgi:hypothetical protein